MFKQLRADKKEMAEVGKTGDRRKGEKKPKAPMDPCENPPPGIRYGAYLLSQSLKSVGRKTRVSRPVSGHLISENK